MGREDLEQERIRTPIDPIRTFMDDPLRMLRVIRFAARFQFDIVEETQEALKRADCQTAFLNKVSRERVGIELDKILTIHPRETNPIARSVYGAQLIYDYHLYRCITLSSKAGSGDYVCALAFVCGLLLIYCCRKFIRRNAGLIEAELNRYNLTCDLRILGYCSLIGENGLEDDMDKNKPVLRAYNIVRHAFKLTNADASKIHAIFRAIKDSAFIDELSDVGFMSEVSLVAFVSELSDVAINLKHKAARMLRDTKALWTVAVILIAAERERTITEGSGILWLKGFMNLVHFWGLHDLQKLTTPLLDGKEIAAALNERPGPIVGKAGDLLFFYQIDHPNATKDDALSALPGLVSKAGLR